MRISFPLFFAFLPGLLLATLAFASEPSVEGPPFRHGGEDAGTMDSCDAEPHAAGMCAGKPTFKINSESSLLDFLDPTLLEDDETLADVRKSVRSGQLVVIRDAFIHEFAEYVWMQLDRNDIDWTRQCDIPTPQLVPGHVTTCKHVPEKRSYSTELLEVMDMLNNTKTKDFMEAISGRKCSGPNTENIVPTWYKTGDFSSPHTHFKGTRSISFLWNLSKDWDPSWGGAFYWSPAGNMEDGYHYPTFNTLLLFLPTPTSVHMVTPVDKNANGKFLQLGGWYSTGGEKDSALAIHDPIEDIYIHEEDHNRLTADAAAWIAHDMDVDTITKDPIRKQKLLGLRKAIANEYLYPLDKSTHVIESYEEDGSTMNATLGQRVDIVEPGFDITAESSILEYLNPTLLKDDETLANVRKSLLDGQLVVIRDAFIPEFAEYVWKQVDMEDLNWVPTPPVSTTHLVPGNVSHKHRLANKKDYPTELLDVLDMFRHPMTTSFMETISGRTCSGPMSLVATSLYKPGDYSSPHSDFKGTRSVSFLWNLSKDWDPSWGGAFYWGASKTVDNGYHYPTFNTLLLFLPTPSSVHAVTPVTGNAKGKRLVLGGWYNTGDEKDTFSIKNPIEDIYIQKEDHNRLTAVEAVWIAHDMDVDKITKDPIRKQKLDSLREAIANEYLYPLDTSTCIIESIDEEE
jgi:Rps23 Pro-64 3,4-dihydroxylase Tpa1-like proline 4-hydroxylase